MKTLSLNKARAILQKAFSCFKKRRKELSLNEEAVMKEKIIFLENAIATNDRNIASPPAEELEKFTQNYCKKSWLDYLKEIVIAIVVALLLATVVRQVWFELYEIPTGSMRPAFREQDRVAVTKTAFGINIPLNTGHLYFDPSLVQRGSAITFTSEGIDKLDEDTIFMGVIPYKKRLIKRLIGKPGDSLYFYGGKIYGVDKDGNLINELLDAPWMRENTHFSLEHIPFMRFSGELSAVGQREVRFSQMNIPIGRMMVNGQNIKGEVSDGKKWIQDDPFSQRSLQKSPKAFSDFFGIRNFAMARLLDAKELKEINGIDAKDLPEGVLYLELSHHPSLTYPQPLISQNSHHPLQLASLKSVIPLQQEHLDRLMDMMYTARIVFKNGRATRYSVDSPKFGAESPTFPGVPDGTYEFYEGNLQKLGIAALLEEANKDNPLYSHDPKNVEKLYNLGIEMHNAYVPSVKNQWNAPSRYAYFRDGDLYALGGVLFQKDDPILTDFNEREEKKEANSTEKTPYTAFKDYGPPYIEGKLDADFIRAFGVTVPEKQYLVLGDNHAMSGDSRIFGFVPQGNLEGAPSLILWPAGERMGLPWQAPYKLLTIPRLIVWGVVAICCLIWYILHRRYLRRPTGL
ncbi:MAG: signal peptidase I [Parachlamydiaceae bacterium]|nr:signal peptidase I [Parachlamydiaceae bacterium]